MRRMRRARDSMKTMIDLTFATCASQTVMIIFLQDISLTVNSS